MNESLIDEIQGIVDGKLSTKEMQRLLVYVNRKSQNMLEEEKEAFFKHLASEMRQEMKELAALIVEFKRDFMAKIHPDITELKVTYIPQAADQLEGIIESTEQAANQIMDNLELMQRFMEEALETLAELKRRAIESGPKAKVDPPNAPISEDPIEMLQQKLERCLPLIVDTFEQMSFQDLTGQRIRRTIQLVNLMEERVAKALCSFGLKITEKNKNPSLSGDELESAVEKRLSTLSGPQRAGQGLNQADIDKLLGSM